MIVQYEDEYETPLIKVVADIAPAVGDSVSLFNEEYVVKHRRFLPKDNSVLITLSESAPQIAVSISNDSSRNNQVNSAIIQLNKRIDATDKKNRALNEQLVTVRKHINQRIRQDKKDSE